MAYEEDLFGFGRIEEIAPQHDPLLGFSYCRFTGRTKTSGGKTLVEVFIEDEIPLWARPMFPMGFSSVVAPSDFDTSVVGTDRRFKYQDMMGVIVYPNQTNIENPLLIGVFHLDTPNGVPYTNSPTGQTIVQALKGYLRFDNASGDIVMLAAGSIKLGAGTATDSAALTSKVEAQVNKLADLVDELATTLTTLSCPPPAFVIDPGTIAKLTVLKTKISSFARELKVGSDVVKISS